LAGEDQEEKLFAEAMGKVRRITPANKVIPEKVKPKPEAAVSFRQAQQPLLQPKAVAASPRQGEEPWVLRADGISRERLKRLAAGHPPVEQTLDLHGVTRNEALGLLEEWFRRSIHDQLRALCIIHGRGLHSSEGKPVLKEAVYQWLRCGPFAHAVLAVIPRPGCGGGACLVLLRRK
jgi:DNA-nicking Smr family endonuclease